MPKHYRLTKKKKAALKKQGRVKAAKDTGPLQAALVGAATTFGAGKASDQKALAALEKERPIATLAGKVAPTMAVPGSILGRGVISRAATTSGKLAAAGRIPRTTLGAKQAPKLGAKGHARAKAAAKDLQRKAASNRRAKAAETKKRKFAKGPTLQKSADRSRTLPHRQTNTRDPSTGGTLGEHVATAAQHSGAAQTMQASNFVEIRNARKRAKKRAKKKGKKPVKSLRQVGKPGFEL